MTSTRIAILDDYQNVALRMADWNKLGPDVQTVAFHDHVADKLRLADRLSPFDVVVLMRERTLFDADMIGLLPNLKMIVTVGLWNAAIDVDAAKARGIVVAGTDARHPNGTPAMTWALILGAMRNLHDEVSSVRSGGWQVGLGCDTAGKVLGVLGLGKIGQVVAKVGLALGMQVIAWSQNLTEEMAQSHGATKVDKDELFSLSDVLTIHLKLSGRTTGLVGARELGLMKPSSLLVNTSRGPIVSESALIDVLEKRTIAGAALDVFDQEPLPAHHPFRYLPNVLATPHIGYVTQHTLQDAYPQIVEDVAAWLSGSPIRILSSPGAS